MRAFDNQISGNRPINRTPAEKEKQLRQLREQLETLPPRAQDSMRATIKAKIVELEGELALRAPRRPS